MHAAIMPLIVALIYTGCFIATAFEASNKNRNIVLWLLLSFLITPVLTYIILLGADNRLTCRQKMAILERQNNRDNDIGRMLKIIELRKNGGLTEAEFNEQVRLFV